MRLKILTIISALGLMMMPVKADVTMALGVIGNMADFNTSGSELDTFGRATPAALKNNETNSTSVSEGVGYGSFFVEGILREDAASTIGITFGIEHIPGTAQIGSKSRTDTASTATDDGSDDAGTYSAKAEISDHTTFYIEPTVYANENIGLYLKGGVSQITVTSLESLSQGDDSSAYGNEDVMGLMYGVGIRARTPWGILIKLEYAETDYGEVTMDSTTGNKNRITAEPEQQAVKLAIGYQF